jgi:hypothetical protein
LNLLSLFFILLYSKFFNSLTSLVIGAHQAAQVNLLAKLIKPLLLK